MGTFNLSRVFINSFILTYSTNTFNKIPLIGFLFICLAHLGRNTCNNIYRSFCNEKIAN